MKRIVQWSVAAALLCAAPAAFAADLNSRIREANEVLKEFSAIPEHRIPPDLLRKAKAIAIFPNTAKAGFVVAGQFGRGVVLVRREDSSWTAPAFFRISGGSVGFQIGGQTSDIILVVTNDRGVRGLLENKFTLGADASVAAGPAGRDAEAKTDWQLKASILSYSRSKGLFAGVSVDGMVINQEKEDNAAYYNRTGITAQEILLDGKVKPSDEAKKLIATIEASVK